MHLEKSEARIPKFETSSNTEIRMAETCLIRPFSAFPGFEFVSNFVIRASDFGDNPVPNRHRCIG